MIPIRLFTCVTLSVEEELEVEMRQVPPILEGYESHDQMVGPVKRVLEAYNLPWNETFVSIFILLPGDSPTALHEAFGYPFELNPDKVIEDIALVCSDDIQNLVRSRVPPRVAMDLRSLSSEEKIHVLRTARLQSNNARAEARMLRPLRAEDVCL